MRKKLFRILMLIVLLCLGIMNYFHNQKVYPLDLNERASTYTGRCINVEAEIVRVARHSNVHYLVQMKDGHEFWIDDAFAGDGDGQLDISYFCNTAPGSILTLSYIDVNFDLGSLAKEVVEIRRDDKVLLSTEAVEKLNQKTQITTWIVYVVIWILFSIPLIFSIQEEYKQRKLSEHRQQTKAQRREWLDAHPEEKGAPPSARRKKNRGRE